MGAEEGTVGGLGPVRLSFDAQERPRGDMK